MFEFDINKTSKRETINGIDVPGIIGSIVLDGNVIHVDDDGMTKDITVAEQRLDTRILRGRLEWHQQGFISP